MDRVTGRLPDPVTRPPNGERRRCVRHKPHTPVYASFNTPATSQVVDLSELLDLHEDGFAVQTAERLDLNRALTVCLDLPETRSFIHGNGQVIWSDDSGRAGIKFSQLPESSRKVLKEWLLANLLIASSNHAARSSQLALNQKEEHQISKTEMSVDIPVSVPSEQQISLDSVRSEVQSRSAHSQNNDFDSILQLITDRTLALTGASGAALAYLTTDFHSNDLRVADLHANDKIICRARSGEPAPPLGSPIDVHEGLSGECVRSGVLVSSDDMLNDPRVDPEIPRLLGIASLMAAPIVANFRVVGLLEVFSPHPYAFSEAHAAILSRLVELIPTASIPKAVRENANTDLQKDGEQNNDAQNVLEASATPATAKAQKVSASSEEPETEEPETVQKTIPQTLHRALISTTIVVVAFAILYLLGPRIEKRLAGLAQSSAQAASSQTSRTENDRVLGKFSSLDDLKKDDLQKLASQGNSDAQYQTALRYHNGEGVPHDDAQAMQWFERAAQQGNVHAQSALGAYYWMGRGVPPDLSKAYFWSAIATAEGDEISKSRLEGLASQMTRVQISNARQQAEEWIHAHTQSQQSGAN